MDELGAVQVFEGFGDLVDDVFVVHLFQNALGDHVVQVRLHVLEHQVDVFAVLGLDSLLQLYDVVVVQLPQDAHLPVGSLGVRGVLECVENLLQGTYRFIGLVLHLPNMAVGAAAHLLQQVESLQDVWLHF